jgi:hypothetical protein
MAFLFSCARFNVIKWKGDYIFWESLGSTSLYIYLNVSYKMLTGIVFSIYCMKDIGYFQPSSGILTCDEDL